MKLQNRIPKEMETFNGMLFECFIAGGAVLSTVTRQEISDYDVYPKTRKAKIDLLTSMIEDNTAVLVKLSSNAATFKLNGYKNEQGQRIIVQIVLGEFPTPESIFERFDFTVCMGAYDVDEKSWYFHDCFWSDIASKTLHFNENTLYPLNSLIRTNKYIQKGYKIPQPQMVKIGLTISNKGMPKTWEDLETQLGGIYGRTVKLNAGDRPCNFENILDVMENIQSVDMSDYDSSDELNDLTIADLLVEMGEWDTVLYRVPESKTNGYQGFYCVRYNNYYILYDTLLSKDSTEKLEKAGLIKNLPEQGLVVGYKILMQHENKWYPAIRGVKCGVTYKFLEWTEKPIESTKGLFLFTDKNVRHGFYGSNEKFKTCYALTRVEDIIKITRHEIETNKIMVMDDISS